MDLRRCSIAGTRNGTMAALRSMRWLFGVSLCILVGCGRINFSYVRSGSGDAGAMLEGGAVDGGDALGDGAQPLDASSIQDGSASDSQSPIDGQMGGQDSALLFDASSGSAMFTEPTLGQRFLLMPSEGVDISWTIEGVLSDIRILIYEGDGAPMVFADEVRVPVSGTLRQAFGQTGCRCIAEIQVAASGQKLAQTWFEVIIE